MCLGMSVCVRFQVLIKYFPQSLPKISNLLFFFSSCLIILFYCHLFVCVKIKGWCNQVNINKYYPVCFFPNTLSATIEVFWESCFVLRNAGIRKCLTINMRLRCWFVSQKLFGGRVNWRWSLFLPTGTHLKDYPTIWNTDVSEWRQNWRLKGKEILKKKISAPVSEFSGCHFGVLPTTLKFGDFLVKHQTFSCRWVK